MLQVKSLQPNHKPHEFTNLLLLLPLHCSQKWPKTLQCNVRFLAFFDIEMRQICVEMTQRGKCVPIWLRFWSINLGFMKLGCLLPKDFQIKWKFSYFSKWRNADWLANVVRSLWRKSNSLHSSISKNRNKFFKAGHF